MTSNSVEGSMRIDGDRGTVVVSSVFATTPDDLWQAVTSLERLGRWFGDISPLAGGESSFHATLTTGWSGTISVTTCEPPTRLSAQLRDADATTTVTAHLEPTDGGTRLTIEESGLEPDGLHTYVVGWHAQLDQLDAILRHGDEVPWRARWEQLREQYTQT